MKKYFVLFLILICSTAYADEKVRVYTDYSPVRVLQCSPGANADLEANKAGLAGAFKDVDASSIPQDRSDRDFWKWESGQIKVDSNKKKSHDDLKTKKESDKASAIIKLKTQGLTDDELKSIGIGG